jgi:outer membrane protein OmpA-like peptidoglycan-associated protein
MKADVPADYIAVLEQVAHVLETHPEIKVLRVEGHCSRPGGFKYNMELSRYCAAAVVGYLMHFGVAPDRLLAQGFGWKQLKIKRKGRNFNRINQRVEFVIVDPSPAVLLQREAERAGVRRPQ